MKKFFLVLIFLLLMLGSSSFASDDSDSSGGIEDATKYTNFVENGFEGQKKVTDEDFQKALEAAKAKRNKKMRIKEKTFEGKGANENDDGYLSDKADKSVILGVPVGLINGDGFEIPIGHYRIEGEKIGGKVYLNFCQSSTVVAHVPAIETNDDFGQSPINFVQLIPYNEDRVKIIFGSLDFNAYTFIKIKDKISDEN